MLIYIGKQECYVRYASFSLCKIIARIFTTASLEGHYLLNFNWGREKTTLYALNLHKRQS